MLCAPAANVAVLKLAESEFRLAVPSVVCVPPLVSRNVTLPLAVDEAVSVAVTEPLP
jgi:hypothetical protein